MREAAGEAAQELARGPRKDAATLMWAAALACAPSEAEAHRRSIVGPGCVPSVAEAEAEAEAEARIEGPVCKH
jgi:hypothetical protein